MTHLSGKDAALARVIHVAGAGIFGLACAWALVRRGAQITVFEAATIGAGSSGGHVGALAPHAPENWNPKKQFQLDSLLIAPAFWAAVEAASGTGVQRAPVQTRRLCELAEVRAEVGEHVQRLERLVRLSRRRASGVVVPERDGHGESSVVVGVVRLGQCLRWSRR